MARLTCVFRAAGTLAGAKALHDTMARVDDRGRLSDWENLTQEQKRFWIYTFREAHKACKEAIRAEANPLIKGESNED